MHRLAASTGRAGLAGTAYTRRVSASQFPHPSLQLFATCIVEHVRPRIGLAVVRVLERLGFDVTYPEGLTCCGQPAFNTGAADEAKAMARHTIDVLSRSPDPIVVPSGSCADMLVHQYPALFASDPTYLPRARAIAARTREFTQCVAATRPVVTAAAASAPVAYHAACHLLRGLNVRDEPVALLRDAVGSASVPLAGAEECCGFGGLFSIKMSEISSAMLRRKLQHVRDSGAQTVVACDASCLLHIEGGLKRQGEAIGTAHLAEVLDRCELTPTCPPRRGGDVPGHDGRSGDARGDTA